MQQTNYNVVKMLKIGSKLLWQILNFSFLEKECELQISDQLAVCSRQTIRDRSNPISNKSMNHFQYHAQQYVSLESCDKGLQITKARIKQYKTPYKEKVCLPTLPISTVFTWFIQRNTLLTVTVGVFVQLVLVSVFQGTYDLGYLFYISSLLMYIQGTPNP